jgi:hypothetical protein
VTTTAPRRHASKIADALGPLEVRSLTGYSWMGEVTELPGHVVRLADRRGVRAALVGSIRGRLYDSFFTQGAPRPAVAEDAGSPGDRGSLSHELAAANEGTGCMEPGWQLIGEEDGRRVVQRSGLRLWVADEEIEAGAEAPRIGDLVAVRLAADLPALSPGFYTARGRRGFSAAGPRLLDRLYLDLRPEGAVPFVREATRRLNRAGLAFVAKVVDDPGGFDRRDAAVLAVERRDRARALAAAEELRAALAPFLDSGAPAMTLPLAPGLAFAEDPGGGESFGAHRCLLLAVAAVTAAERGLGTAEDRLEVVRERFAEAGTTLDAPHLGSSPGDVIGGADPLDGEGLT